MATYDRVDVSLVGHRTPKYSRPVLMLCTSLNLARTFRCRPLHIGPEGFSWFKYQHSSRHLFLKLSEFCHTRASLYLKGNYARLCMHAYYIYAHVIFTCFLRLSRLNLGMRKKNEGKMTPTYFRSRKNPTQKWESPNRAPRTPFQWRIWKLSRTPCHGCRSGPQRMTRLAVRVRKRKNPRFSLEAVRQSARELRARPTATGTFQSPESGSLAIRSRIDTRRTVLQSIANLSALLLTHRRIRAREIREVIMICKMLE